MPAANPGSGATCIEGYSIAHGPINDATGYGGDCIQMLSGAALNVGDAVFQSAANTATKGVTANNALRCGVVVGGVKTRFRTFPESKVGDTAADAAGQVVLVCFSGKVRATADGVVAAGDKVAFGATGGRLITTATATGIILGIALSAAAGAASTFDVLVAPS